MGWLVRANPGTVGAGAATLPSAKFTSTAKPTPSGSVKTPGADGTSDTFCDAVWPPKVTCMFTVAVPCPFANASKGTCALTIPAAGTTALSGAGTPLKETVTPPSEVENGTVSALACVAPRPDPKIATSDPGATGVPWPEEF